MSKRKPLSFGPRAVDLLQETAGQRRRADIFMQILNRALYGEPIRTGNAELDAALEKETDELNGGARHE